MAEIQLLAVENIISRKKRRPEQRLTFHIDVENIDFHKQVEVIWCGESGEWHTLAADFQARLDDRRERWRAQFVCQASAKQSLPGNIQFGLRLRCQGQEYWDNRQGNNYQAQADSGYQLGSGIQIAHIGYHNRLQTGQKTLELTVLTGKDIQPEQVAVLWTVDNWQSQRKSHCQSDRLFWDEHYASNARNPNQYGVKVWTAKLRCGRHFRLQYSIFAQTAEKTIWDNNAGHNYSLSHKPLSLLILNLHCYQESSQDEKFSIIAKAIDEQEVDVVCFQEAAENWNDGQGDRASNAANIINQRLKKPFELFYDWSHLGFDRFREGVAILSRYGLKRPESRYVSEDTDPYSIHSRKVVAADIDIPCIGLVQVFSVHLSWWEDGFAEQFQHLHEWATQRQEKRMKATLLAGDFNIATGSEGYRLVVRQYRYEDQYLLANRQGLSGEQFRVDDAHWGDYLADDYRIDYVFANSGHQLKVTSARTLFSSQDYGRVSDHVGYLFTFEPLN